jgi:hypothetical protein
MCLSFQAQNCCPRLNTAVQTWTAVFRIDNSLSQGRIQNVYKSASLWPVHDAAGQSFVVGPPERLGHIQRPAGASLCLSSVTGQVVRFGHAQ